MDKKVMITETILRDAHQSQAATRMSLEDMLPALDALDDIGYYSLEAWGGATFDSCLRFLNEDPWERLRVLKSHLKKTKIQMLLRGQNLLGYKHYTNDVVDKFVEYAIKNGVDVIRVFDALNDVENLKAPMAAIKKYRGICEATISYTTSPVHTNEYFVKLAKTLEDMGADNICLKDMANLLLPYTAYDLISAMKKVLKPETKIHLHTHNTTGTGDMVNLKAIEAGCDIVDCALSAMGNGTSQPATEPLVVTLAGTKYDTGIDVQKLIPITEHFKKVADKLEKEGRLNPNVRKINVNTLKYQVPGGMLSNLMGQLKDQGKLDKLDEVLEEVPNVRKDCGYPPLVTPSSQIVGTQAVLNVLSGERYKMVTKEFKNLLLGGYGHLPAPCNEEVVKKCCGDAKPVKEDLTVPEYDKIKAEMSEYYTKEEDVLTYAMFPEVSVNYFKYRLAKEKGVDKDLAEAKDKVYPV
ncbi:MAG: pyruvate carboxylase subunit B [Candidatus Borkfalkiaceae bacterium]|nr:pyruvate carboxylase subunit B [Christensenellaceae bacterium]